MKYAIFLGVALVGLTGCVEDDFATGYDYSYTSQVSQAPQTYRSTVTTSTNYAPPAQGYQSTVTNAPPQAPAGGYSSTTTYAPPAAPQNPPAGYGSSVSEQHATVESSEPEVHVKPRIGVVMPPRAATTSGGYSSNVH